MEKRNRFLKIAVVSAGLYCLGTAGVAMPSVSAASTVSAGDTAVTAGGVSVADGTGRAARAEQTWTKRMGTQTLGIEKTDPELAALMKGYIYGDIACQAALTPQEQDMVTLAVLTVNQDYGLLRKNVQGALQYGVTPLEIRETLYHMAPYIGFPRVIEAVEVMNGVFRKNGIRLPLDAQGTTTDADRFAKGFFTAAVSVHLCRIKDIDSVFVKCCFNALIQPFISTGPVARGAKPQRGNSIIFPFVQRAAHWI